MSVQRLVIQKNAIEKILKSKNGKKLIEYIGDVCLGDMGVPSSNAYDYAFKEGKRSVFLALLQMAEINVSHFIHDRVKLNNMVDNMFEGDNL